jgi:tetratricopeptide (TPR) repeat protein
VDRTVELLAATIGVGETEVLDRSALLAAWRSFFEIAARRQPLVLVFEDLHWSSDSLLDLFEFVMQPRGELPLLMIALTRPELLDRRPAWGGGRKNYMSLALEPLSDAETETLVRRLLEGQAPELVERVVRHAEGNPFFAGELVRSTLERPRGGELPDTVQAAVLARLDLLAPAERRVIQIGAVFGRSFRLAGIQALESAQDDLHGVVERLLEKDLLRTSAGDSFTFRHILIREVAYQTLTRAERGRLHAAAAGWLEALAGDRVDGLAELIAFHYREAAMILTAQRPGDAETERIRKNAVDWLSRAAEVAAAAAATLEGSRHLRAAIELADGSRLPDLYRRLGEMAESGDLVVEAYQTALQLAREQGRSSTEQLMLLARLLTTHMRFTGSVTNRPSDAAMADLRGDAKSLASVVSDEHVLGSYYAAEAFYPFWLRSGERPPTAEQVAEADRSGRRALELARRVDDPKLQSVALDALSSTAQMQDDWQRALELARERLGFQDRLGVEEKIDAHAMVAWSSAMLGDLEEAARVSAAGLAQVQPGQFPAWTLHVAGWRIYSLALLGQWDAALTAAERARQLWIESGRSPAGYALFGFIAALDVARARMDPRLIQLYEEVIDVIVAAFPPGAPARSWQGVRQLDFNAVESSIIEAFGNWYPQRYERALNLLLDHDRLLPVSAIAQGLTYAREHRVSLIEAQAERAIGRVERDIARLNRSLALFERAGALPLVARVRCERALLTGDRNDMETGLAMLERLGDLAQMGRFERLAVG